MKTSPLTWRIEKRKIADLKPAAYNPRKMSESEERDLGESIDEFGTVVPIVANVGKRDGILIGGHQRTKLYEKKGMTEVDVMVPSRELTIAEEKRLNLRLNKNTGSWDPDKLKDMGLTLLLDVGFGDEELQIFFDDVDVIDDEFNVGAAVREIKNPKTKHGDVIELGEHRLVCGSPLDPDAIADLMGKDKADLLHMEPPRVLDDSFLEAVQDEKTKEGKHAAILGMLLENMLAAAKPNAHVFTWTDDKYVWLIQSLYREQKVAPKRICIWIKKDFQITAKVAFNKAYEPCVYGILGKEPYLNPAVKNLSEILNKEVANGNHMIDDILDSLTVWLDRRPKGDTGEYTGKPVTLLERPLKRCTAPGHVMLDLFAGAGSTLMACEQLKRRARVVQSDPIMCDVIVKRWEEFTNQKANRL